MRTELNNLEEKQNPTTTGNYNQVMPAVNNRLIVHVVRALFFS